MALCNQEPCRRLQIKKMRLPSFVSASVRAAGLCLLLAIVRLIAGPRPGAMDPAPRVVDAYLPGIGLVDPTSIAVSAKETRLSEVVLSGKGQGVEQRKNVSRAYFINGGLCNRLLELAFIYTFAKSINANVLLHSRLARRIAVDFDVEHMQTASDHGFVFDFSGKIPLAHSFIEAPRGDYPAVHCVSRLSLDFFGKVLRPKLQHREVALKQIQSLTRRGAQRIVSVHARGFELQGCPGMLNKFGPVCHVLARLNGGDDTKDVLCNTTVEHVTLLVKEEWPDITDWTSTGFYLSTDSQPNHRTADASYDAMPLALKSRKDTLMIVDMWTNTLADFYLANPVSTCEPIIAQWRIANQRLGRTYPRSCFDGFSRSGSSSLDCAHVDKIVTISPPPIDAPPCALVRALSSALDRAEPGGGLWLYGAYADWFRMQFPDPALFSRAYQVEVSFKRGTPNKGFFAEPNQPHFWGAILLDYANATAHANFVSSRRLAQTAGLGCDLEVV